MNGTRLSEYGGSGAVQFAATGYFYICNSGSKYWFVDPDGCAFISLGVNHCDESSLKYPHNIDIWRKKYGSRENWIKKGVVRDLRAWGFNTIGWTQEWISGEWGCGHMDIIHSQQWSAADLIGSDMPYIVQLPVGKFEDFNGNPDFPDVYGTEFDQYCQFLARSICSAHAESRSLIGYSLTDLPAWRTHETGRFFSSLGAHSHRLTDIAGKYYETIAKYIRMYDSNHLILGDRYNGFRGVPEEVLKASEPFIDAVSVQWFSDVNIRDRPEMIATLNDWYRMIDKPIFLADIGNWTATELNPKRARGGLSSQAARGEDYANLAALLADQSWCIGWHWCGYVENLARGWGLKDPWDEPYTDFTDAVSQANSDAYARRLNPLCSSDGGGTSEKAAI